MIIINGERPWLLITQIIIQDNNSIIKIDPIECSGKPPPI